jgi:hypothetical protein
VSQGATAPIPKSPSNLAAAAVLPLRTSYRVSRSAAPIVGRSGPQNAEDGRSVVIAVGSPLVTMLKAEIGDVRGFLCRIIGGLDVIRAMSVLLLTRVERGGSRTPTGTVYPLKQPGGDQITLQSLDQDPGGNHDMPLAPSRVQQTMELKVLRAREDKREEVLR